MHLTRLALLAALVLGLAACGGSDEGDSTGDEGTTTAAEAVTTGGSEGGCRSVEAPAAKENGGLSAPTERLDAAKTYRLVVETNCGSFTITLDQKQSPNTAASLVALAKGGFYDGTTFHRVVPGFVIQGGDPTGAGTGGPGYQTVDPPPPGATYVQGVVAMAKSTLEAPGTSGSQFFVVTGADIGLPPDYAIVGKVTEGLPTMLAIDALGAGDGPPSMPVVMEKVTVEES